MQPYCCSLRSPPDRLMPQVRTAPCQAPSPIVPANPSPMPAWPCRTPMVRPSAPRAQTPTGHFSVHHVAPGTYAVVVAARRATQAGSSIATASEGVDASVAVALSKSDAIDVQVNAKRLDRARNGLLPETGSTVYRFSQADIDTLPAGQDTPLNQVLLQAPRRGERLVRPVARTRRPTRTSNTVSTASSFQSRSAASASRWIRALSISSIC